MTGSYMGETSVNQEDTPYKDYTPFDWGMYFIERYGHIDGDHHKMWVMDQVARLHKGTQVQIKLAQWTCGTKEYRVTLGEPTQQYLDWVEEMKCMEDGEYQYDYDEGIAP